MPRLIHISDLHFGKTEPQTVAALERQIHDLKPQVIAVSGDLTQRARSAQFEAAAEFLAGLKYPQVVVPGNHDVPLFDLASRLLSPYEKYRRYIGETEPFYEDDCCVVAGINTAHGLTIGQGKVSETSLRNLRERFDTQKIKKIRVLVSHHPLDLFDHAAFAPAKNRVNVPQARALMPDVLLAGHLHRSSADTTAMAEGADHRRYLVVQCGTSASTRHRGETNSFNELDLQNEAISVKRWTLNEAGNAFVQDLELRFRLTPQGWART